MDFVAQNGFLILNSLVILLLIAISFTLFEYKKLYWKKQYLIVCKTVSKQLEEKVLQDIEIKKLIKELETKDKEFIKLYEAFQFLESKLAEEQKHAEPKPDEPKPAIKQKLKLKDLKEVTVEELQDNAKYILQNKYKNNFWKGDTLTDDINKADRVDKQFILRWLRDQGKTSFLSTRIFETPENETDMLSEVQKELLGRRFWLPGSDRIHVLTKNPKYPLYYSGNNYREIWGRNAALNYIYLVNSYGEKLYIII
jgi:hypothetical protein